MTCRPATLLAALAVGLLGACSSPSPATAVRETPSSTVDTVSTPAPSTPAPPPTSATTPAPAPAAPAPPPRSTTSTSTVARCSTAPDCGTTAADARGWRAPNGSCVVTDDATAADYAAADGSPGATLTPDPSCSP